jgi:hypothetical protein
VVKMALLAAVAFDGGRRLMTEIRGSEWQHLIVVLAFNGGGNGQQQGDGGGREHIDATCNNQIKVTEAGGDHMRLRHLT